MSRAELLEKICYTDYTSECSACDGRYNCSDCKEAINPLLDEYDKQIRADAIDEFADYLRMSYDKGMRLSIAMCKNEIEKFKLKALYSKFIDAIDDCVKAFNELEQLKEQKNE